VWEFEEGRMKEGKQAAFRIMRRQKSEKKNVQKRSSSATLIQNFIFTKEAIDLFLSPL